MTKNTEELHALMNQFDLSVDDVARILERTTTTVRIWRVKKTQRPIPRDALELLRLKLTHENAQGAAA